MSVARPEPASAAKETPLWSVEKLDLVKTSPSAIGRVSTLPTTWTESGRPFELNPQMGPEGQDVTEHLTQKYGSTPAQQAQAFEDYIQSSVCLREHRGRILERNTCRNKWTNFLNVSLRQSVPTLRGPAFSFQVDVFNFLNLLNEDWGLVETTSSLSTLNLLTHRAQSSADRATAVPIVDFNPGFEQFFSNSLSSNYQIQLSARYEF